MIAVVAGCFLWWKKLLWGFCLVAHAARELSYLFHRLGVERRAWFCWTKERDSLMTLIEVEEMIYRKSVDSDKQWWEEEWKDLHCRRSKWMKVLENNSFNLSMIEIKKKEMTVNDEKSVISSNQWEFIDSNKKQQSQEFMKKKKKLLESEFSKNTLLKKFEHAINLLWFVE